MKNTKSQGKIITGKNFNIFKNPNKTKKKI